jgi:anti-sigma factor RsiW
MQKHSDEALVAYLDGELDGEERGHVEAWLDADPAVRDRLLALAESAGLVRNAFADIVNEPLPERLLAAARGETAPAAAAASEAEIVMLRPSAANPAAVSSWRWHVQLAAAAGIFGLLVGVGAGYFGNGILAPAGGPGNRSAETASLDNWLDNAAGNYKLMVSAGGSLVDLPATGDNGEVLQKISQTLPQQVRLPDLKPWGLNFQGARLVVVEGRPGAQLVYTTDNKAIGPLTLIIGSTKEPDLAPTPGKRQDLNLLYWRHQGRASILVGQSEIGYLWNISRDVAWQLDAI